VTALMKGSLVPTQISLPTANGRPEESLEKKLRRQIMAQTPSLLSLIERIVLVATHDVTVLLNGETGTGKSFLARLIHDHSPRKDQRFLTVSCGAISGNLAESEFFGHAKGAFTGADQARVGKFAAVGEGTLLLDEVDTLSLDQQATLLRVIETGEFEPVGCTETQRCKARLIVASNINLEHAVQRGEFRSDLFFRLNVMSYFLPPLRERIQDISLLASAMVNRLNEKFGKQIRKISRPALAALESYPWPGNIRQLENIIQSAVLVSTGPELLLKHLPHEVQGYVTVRQLPPEIEVEVPEVHTHAHCNGRGRSLHEQRDVLEKQLIERALLENANSRSRAAKALGISRVALYKKLKKFGFASSPSKSVAEYS
jgi:two-component system, NtrC family, response regulator HydG